MIALLRQAIAVNAGIGSPENIANVRQCLAEIFRKQKRFREQVIETALGNEHSSLLAPLNNLATTYLKMSRFDDAELTFQHAENYAVVLRMLDRKLEAKKFKEQGRKIEQASNRRNGVGATISVDALRSDRTVSDPW